MTDRRIDLVERKAQLVTRAELDRARIMLAAREVRAIAAPDSAAERATRYRPAAAFLLSVMGPALGTSRLRGWLRIAWMALAAVRILRSWK